MGLMLITPPAAEPLTLAELKSWLKVDIGDDDDLITAIGKGARGVVEDHTNRALITQTWKLTLPRLGPQPVRLPIWPVQSVSSVTYTDWQGTSQTWTGPGWALSAAEPPEIVPAYNQLWPIQWAGGLTLGPRADAAAVTFVAGYGAAGAAVPEPLKLAIRLLVGHYYNQRRLIVEGRMGTLPWMVEAVLGPYWTGQYG